ncbi:hypothetical protein PSTG_06333 [Puccinia striiformis f. sp. tritici PST-78]|uniref:Uncharacterized protein n=2 Tax=Puccinia striiformis f. sp. tritici TaxID=168172 RepID=A0A0L0VN08_9BASI|nr:hypothetical protein PSTG_06333 [Puccinia striiformis f. sp. tritici PST-78]
MDPGQLMKQDQSRSQATPSRKRVRLFGVDLSDEHNTRLEEARVGREKDDPQSIPLSLKPEDTLGTIPLEAYAALVPELFVCQFGSKGTIPELLEYLRNPPFGFPGNAPWIQRIDNTATWLQSKDIGVSNRFKPWDLLPRTYKQVESDFNMIKAREVLKEISLERYLELAHVVLESSQYWHKELEHFLVNDMESREWAKERGYTLAYLTIIFFKTYKINLKNHDLESESQEHLVQNLLKDLMKVLEKKTLISKDGAGPSRKQFSSCSLAKIRFSGVGEHNEHNTGLKEAQVQRGKGHTQSHTFSFKPEDTLDKTSLEAYAALVPDLYRCRFGNKGTIPELSKYLDARNPPPSLPKDEAVRKRIYDTRAWLHSKDIEINTSYKHWSWGPSMYREVESDFNTMKAIEAFPRISLEMYLELAPVVLGYPHDWNQDLRHFLGQNIHFADGQQERGYKLAFWTVWFLKLHHFDLKKYDLQTKNQGAMAQFLMNDLVKAFKEKMFKPRNPL